MKMSRFMLTAILESCHTMVEFLVQGYRTKNLGGAGSEPKTAHDFYSQPSLLLFGFMEEDQ
jgi:hypothetical protein